MHTIELPQVGYTIRESEQILGYSSKYLYRLIREGKVDAYLDTAGQMRISREETYRLMHDREVTAMS